MVQKAFQYKKLSDVYKENRHILQSICILQLTTSMQFKIYIKLQQKENQSEHLLNEPRLKTFKHLLV